MLAIKTRSAKPATKAIAFAAVALIAFMALAPLSSGQTTVSILGQPDYAQFVHTYANTNSTKGNWTSVEKPMFPVYFNDSQIGIGCSWSVVEPLVAGHNYHVYCYGEFVNNGPSPQTDYDIYVYNPLGTLVSEHLSSAGLPQHLGTTVDDPFFTPATTGNYTFVISNPLGMSNGTQQATFMAIENIETNQWFNATVQGRNPDGSAAYSTSWAYEFVTDSPQIEMHINVPSSLSLYEARLYLMSDQNSLFVNDAPLPWEPGLYGNLTGNVGGFNLDAIGYRGVSFASDEYKGQDLLLNYSSATPGKTLYHLVLIGQAGLGNVNVFIKTRFGDSFLLPTVDTEALSMVSNLNATKISYFLNSTGVLGAALNYTNDNWNTTQQLPMSITNRTITATIPKQRAGTFVQYEVFANDTLLNTLAAQGNYTVKQFPNLSIAAVGDTLRVGENVTIQGLLTGVKGNASVCLQIMSAKNTENLTMTTLSNGTFVFNIVFNATEKWVAEVEFSGDSVSFPAYSNQILLQIQDQSFLVKNGVFIGGGGFFGVVGLCLFYYIKKRKQ